MVQRRQTACGAGFGEYCRNLAPPLLATLLASGIAFIAARQVSYAWQLVVGAMTLGAVYLACSLWLNRSWLHAMRELAEPLWKPALRRR